MQLHPAMHLSIKDYTEARVAKAGLITLDAKLDLERPAQSLLQSCIFLNMFLSVLFDFNLTSWSAANGPLESALQKCLPELLVDINFG